MATHKEYGGSGAYRWIACPGSIRLCRGIPSVASSYAEEGTRAHALNQWCLENNAPIAQAPVTLRMEDESEAACQVYIDLCNGIALGEMRRIEMQLDMTNCLSDDLKTANIGIGGTADFVAMQGNRLYVVDYKHGKGVAVELDGNPQMLFYALGALANRPQEWPTPRAVRLIVCQPRCRDNEAVQTLDIKVDDVWAWAKNVMYPAIRKSLAPDAPVIPGEKHCRFCPAAGICAAFANKAMDQAKEDFGPILEGGKPPRLPEVLTYDQMARIVRAREVFDNWLNAVEALAFKVLSDGGKIEGLKLVRKRANRRWKDGAEAMLVKAFGELEAYSRKPISPAAAEALAKAMKAPVAVKEEIAAFAEKPEGELTLAPVEDKREAVALVAQIAMDFADDLLS